MPRSVLVLLAAAAVLSGCVALPDDVAPAGLDARADLPYLDLGDGHDHKNRSQHNVSWNVRHLGWDPVAPDATKLGRYNHLDMHGSFAFVSAYSLQNGSAGGLAVLDVSGDAPKLVATLELPDMTPVDVHVSEDGKYAILAAHRNPQAKLPTADQPCTGTPLFELCFPFVPVGVALVDVSDPANPRLADLFRIPPSGAHTAKIVQQAGGYYVYAADYGALFAGRAGSTVDILKVEDTPAGTKLRPVARFDAATRAGNQVFVHDVWVERHPVLGKDLLYVSHWDGGVVVADVTDPQRPTQLADWRDFDAGTYGNVHFARPVGVVNGTHVTLAAPEFEVAEHAGESYLLDTTDPAAPKLLGKWTMPGDPITETNYLHSPHYFDVRGTLVVMAHYHGGVWVLDVADPAAPVVKGYVFPTVPDSVPDVRS
ncbi:MAG TPA: hypothetical protein VHH36_03155, partial [Candidatus Thermoplasmatota archaeon]|nr:hypothetical protein [Candidatus Thermoplasmatota archaeon]